MKKRSIAFAVVVLGITSITSQIIFIRELISVFYGNELAIGTFLGAWLLWTALGSHAFSKMFSPQKLYRHIGLLQWCVCVLLPVCLLLIKQSPLIRGAATGEMMGYTFMLTITLVSLAPFCLVNGLLYTLSCRFFDYISNNASKSISKVYFLEALGSGIGGLVLSFILLPVLLPDQIILFLVVLNFTSGVIAGQMNPFQNHLFRKAWIAFLTLLFLSLVFYIAPIYQNLLTKNSRSGFKTVQSRQSIYGNILVTKIKEQFNFFQNGVYLFSIPDKLTAEESVHYALLEHPKPQSVLLIGGGAGGSVQEAHKHPSIQTVDYVELDPLLTRLAFEYADRTGIEFSGSDATEIFHGDGRLFVKSTSEKYDVIILNMPNPYSAQLNRFYTLEFYHEVRRILKIGGIVSVQIPSSENAIGPELAAYMSVIYTTLKRSFRDVIALPGETTRFFASTQSGVLTTKPDTLVARLQKRNLSTLYVREYFIPYIFSKERQQALHHHLRPVSLDRLNRDFKPAAYYFDTLLWAKTYSKTFQSIFLLFSRIQLLHILLFLFVGIIVFFMFRKIVWTAKRQKQMGVQISIWSVGFSEISLEIILILGFQILYGYAYHFLAVVIAGYMGGLALGSASSFSNFILRRKSWVIFKKLQLTMFLYALIIAGLFFLFHQYSLKTDHFVWIKWIFPFLTLGAGWIGGLQFPLANQIFIEMGEPLQHVAGKMFALDLFGSACGAFFTTAFLIPILGIYPILILISIFNLCGFLILTLSESPTTNRSDVL